MSASSSKAADAVVPPPADVDVVQDDEATEPAGAVDVDPDDQDDIDDEEEA